MASGLYFQYPLALQASYSDLKQRALDPAPLLLGTPGSVSEKLQDGRRYFFRQFWDAEGAKTGEYIGPVDDPDAASRADGVRDQVALAKALVADAQMLARVGYVRVDARTEAVLVCLANAGVFRGGAVVVGSHALGAIANDLGVRISAFSTDDLDIARRERLDLGPHTPSFVDLLKKSRVPVTAVPTFDRKDPSTSFAVAARRQGRAGRFRVDLLAPMRGEPYRPVAVPELQAHALGMPHLRYLLMEPVSTVILGRSAMIPVNVPQPERLAWHKLLVSQLRTGDDKRGKDTAQAAALIAALTIARPEQLVAAYGSVSPSSKKKMRPAMQAVAKTLDQAGHLNAAALVRDLLEAR